ncbi:alpha/beta fold hydrolase [Novosphingobium mangrovi (ex Huang et al. 2023)]|uniref:Alpha/beta hydrolase n=1 Tax=Novosphingobium mangrovi (ex Huang et al. 2023) TaxID=2976432 RepID=A0ABT2I5D3_9SPHN|nr:alpha/beta hydrolase [Novosphingobium mangrovi (ex Huang et al. 2023)]MCT2399808.1 alpha/beta hydrolase [Novosphingobium mangrovi (ex Huang et al. 2023)]
MISVAEQNADPVAFLAELEARAERVETPCGEGTMVWRIWGEGSPLVLAHGAQGSWTHWVRNLERLSRRHRLIVADLPGHGQSAMPETQDHEGISKALAQGLDEIFGSEGLPVDLCGFSFGGVALAHLAALYPHVVRRLVIVGCGGLDTPIGHPRLGRVSGLVGEERRAALKANLLGLMLHHPDSADDLAIHMLLPTAKAARLNASQLVLPDRLAKILPRVRVPVDAIWGELDLPHPDPAAQEAVLRAIQPETIFKVIEGAGHWAMYERPEPFEAALEEILATPLRTMPG